MTLTHAIPQVTTHKTRYLVQSSIQTFVGQSSVATVQTSQPFLGHFVDQPFQG